MRKCPPCKAPPTAVHQTYLNGDLAEYTGEQRDISGGIFYVLIMLEGRFAGAEKVTARPPAGPDPYAVESKKAWREQQAAFKRLHKP